MPGRSRARAIQQAPQKLLWQHEAVKHIAGADGDGGLVRTINDVHRVGWIQPVRILFKPKQQSVNTIILV